MVVLEVLHSTCHRHPVDVNIRNRHKDRDLEHILLQALILVPLFYKSKAHNTCVFSNTQYTNLLYCLFFVDAPCVNVVLLMRSFLIWAQVSSPCQNLLTAVLEFKSFEPIDLSDRVSRLKFKQ